MDRLPNGHIRYPSHSWGVFADNPDLEVGATGDAWIEAVRDAWLESGGTEEAFEEMFPEFSHPSPAPA
jgi:hypothetical protein